MFRRTGSAAAMALVSLLALTALCLYRVRSVRLLEENGEQGRSPGLPKNFTGVEFAS